MMKENKAYHEGLHPSWVHDDDVCLGQNRPEGKKREVETWEKVLLVAIFIMIGFLFLIAIASSFSPGLTKDQLENRDRQADTDLSYPTH